MLSSNRVRNISSTWGFFFTARMWNLPFREASRGPSRAPHYIFSGYSLMNATISSALQKQSAVKVSAAP